MARLDRRSRTTKLNESLQFESLNKSTIEDTERQNRSVIDYARSQSPPSNRMRDASPSQCHICGKARQAQCKACGFNVCKAHMVTDPENRKVCEACYRKVLVNSKAAALAGEEKEISKVQVHIQQHEDERDQRLETNRDFDTKVARLKETARRNAEDFNDELKKLEERLLRERDRNSKVQSQVKNFKLALEDAKRSEHLSSQRKSEAEAQGIVQTNELNFLRTQNLDLTSQVVTLTAECKTIVHCRQFLLMGCRDCKRKFTAKFRGEMMRANLSFDNFSFMSTNSSVAMPRASVAQTDKEACRCELM